MSVINNAYSKLFGCHVHGSIRINPIALKIIDTPEFQRLRKIKQLGLCHYVYPAATHTRFEHSIGVYHLVDKVLEKIQQQYPNREYIIPDLSNEPIKLAPIIIECIKIAGLCHDIGHGPFSHIFDNILLKNSLHPNRTHETRSCLIIDILCKRVLSSELDHSHVAFIKSIIKPEKRHTGALYQIVSNYLNGIDVDKFDYLMRDAKNLGLMTSFCANRLINEFIIDQNDNIAYPKHCTYDIYELFHSRYMMHKKVYSHKTVKLIELMLHDLFIKIDPIFKISKSIENMTNFCELTDDTIFNYISTALNLSTFFQFNMNETQHNLILEANKIYQNIIMRNLYQQIDGLVGDKNTICYMYNFCDYLFAKYPEIDKNDVQILSNKIGFVSDNTPDPFDSIFFYDKKEDTNTFTIKKNHISGLINNETQEIHWNLICKQRSIYQIIVSELALYKKSHSIF